MPPFFHLTSAFFGLTSEYKVPLLEEMFICMQHLKMSYTDVLFMSSYERRFFLGLLTRQASEREEQMDKVRNQTSGGKGTRKSVVSGDALKSRLNSGDIPLN